MPAFLQKLYTAVIGGGARAISAAQEAVKREFEALSLDFTDSYFKDNITSDFNGSAYVLDSGTPANDFDGVPDDLLTYTAPSIKNVLDASGNLVYNAHNWFKYSNKFDESPTWGVSNVTPTQGAADPDGGTDAWTVTEDITTGTRQRISQQDLGGSGTRKWGLWLKQGDRQYVILKDGSNNGGIFNLAGGTVNDTAGVTGTITPGPDNWYYCTLEYDSWSAGNVYVQASEVNSIDDTYNGDGSVAFYCYQCQWTSTPADESYVESTSASVPACSLPYDHYTSGTLRGLLVEPEATNLLTDSQDFNGAGWTGVNAATPALDATGPDGVANSATTLVDDSGTGTGAVYVFDTVTVSTATAYTYSVYAKADQLSWLYLAANSFTTPANGGVYFDLSTGAVGTASTGHTGSIEDVGSGWYRCSTTFTTDAVVTSGQLLVAVAEADTDNIVDLDGTSSILIYGAQFETGTTPTSLIKTYGATATRANDYVTLSVSSYPGTTTKTYYVEIEKRLTDPIQIFLEEAAPSRSDSVVQIDSPTSSDSFRLVVRGAGFSTQADFQEASSPGVNRCAISAQTNDFYGSVNGSTETPDTSGTFQNTTHTTLGIGSGVGPTSPANGHIRRVVILSRLVSDSGLESWTTTGDLPDA